MSQDDHILQFHLVVESQDIWERFLYISTGVADDDDFVPLETKEKLWNHSRICAAEDKGQGAVWIGLPVLLHLVKAWCCYMGRFGKDCFATGEQGLDVGGVGIGGGHCCVVLKIMRAGDWKGSMVR